MQSGAPGSFHVTVDHTAEVEVALRELGEVLVLVGVPESAPARRSPDKINNAALLFIHEHGSPAQNIPARPSLNPGVKNSQPQWAKFLERAAKAALEFDRAAMNRGFHSAGLTAVAAVKKTITAGIPPPLKQATVSARRRRHPSRKATAPEHTTPLVDTAQMLNSITYVLGKKGKK